MASISTSAVIAKMLRGDTPTSIPRLIIKLLIFVDRLTAKYCVLNATDSSYLEAIATPND